MGNFKPKSVFSDVISSGLKSAIGVREGVSTPQNWHMVQSRSILLLKFFFVKSWLLNIYQQTTSQAWDSSLTGPACQLKVPKLFSLNTEPTASGGPPWRFIDGSVWTHLEMCSNPERDKYIAAIKSLVRLPILSISPNDFKIRRMTSHSAMTWLVSK
jgi:hypothetical protein